MNCIKCGEILSEGAITCPECGAPAVASDQTPVPGHVLAATELADTAAPEQMLSAEAAVAMQGEMEVPSPVYQPGRQYQQVPFPQPGQSLGMSPFLPPVLPQKKRARWGLLC